VNENAKPSGASLHDINTAALAAANAIEAKGGHDEQQRDTDLNWGEERVEWGSFVFVLNGVVGYTTPYTHNMIRTTWRTKSQSTQMTSIPCQMER